MLLVLLAAVAFADIHPDFWKSYEPKFNAFKERFGREYEGNDHSMRLQIYAENMMEIEKVNREYAAGEITWWAGENQFTDMTAEEFEYQFVGKECAKFFELKNEKVQLEKNEFVDTGFEAPSSVDWVQKGAVTDVKNQGQCGSCWSFSSTGALEGAYQIQFGELLSFSEQQLVDCAGSEGNQGCNGGLMDDAFKYYEKNGADLESDYPYSAKDGRCGSASRTAKAKVASYTDVASQKNAAFIQALSQQPLAIGVDAQGSAWQMYSGGVMSNKKGIFGSGCGYRSLDHGVLAVGFGSDGGKDYIKVKNSWGPSWGEQGYIRLENTGKDDSGTCGCQLQPSWPKAAQV